MEDIKRGNGEEEFEKSMEFNDKEKIEHLRQCAKELEEYARLWAKQIIELGGIPNETLSDFSGYETPFNNGEFYYNVLGEGD